MSVDRSLEEEQSSRAGLKRHEDCHYHALAWGQDAADGTERNVPWYIGESAPVQVALVT